jgi:hypothetical protein
MTLTVIYNDQALSIEAQMVNGEAWVNASAMADLTGFEFKPEGACYGSVCIPLPPVKGQVIHANGALNLPAVATRLGQAMVADDEAGVISLGPIPEVRQRFAEGQAPDFNLQDRQGKRVSLSMYKDKKVILMTWASW